MSVNTRRVILFSSICNQTIRMLLKSGYFYIVMFLNVMNRTPTVEAILDKTSDAHYWMDTLNARNKRWNYPLLLLAFQFSSARQGRIFLWKHNINRFFGQAYQTRKFENNYTFPRNILIWKCFNAQKYSHFPDNRPITGFAEKMFNSVQHREESIPKF